MKDEKKLKSAVDAVLQKMKEKGFKISSLEDVVMKTAKKFGVNHDDLMASLDKEVIDEKKPKKESVDDSHIKVIAESHDSSLKLCEEEDENGEKEFYIVGIFAQAEIVNKNRRLYPREVMAEAVELYNREFIQKKQSIGELNHPYSPIPNPKEASHIVTELWMNGNNVMGKAKVLKSLPNGKIVKDLIESGVNLGVSTRGIGKLSYDEETNVSTVEKFVINAIDVVSNPSAPDAIVNGIYESVDLNEILKFYEENTMIDFKTLFEENSHSSLQEDPRKALSEKLVSKGFDEDVVEAIMNSFDKSVEIRVSQLEKAFEKKANEFIEEQKEFLKDAQRVKAAQEFLDDLLKLAVESDLNKTETEKELKQKLSEVEAENLKQKKLLKVYEELFQKARLSQIEEVKSQLESEINDSEVSLEKFTQKLDSLIKDEVNVSEEDDPISDPLKENSNLVSSKKRNPYLEMLERMNEFSF